MTTQLGAAAVYFAGAILALVVVPSLMGFVAAAALAFLGGNALIKAFDS